MAQAQAQSSVFHTMVNEVLALCSLPMLLINHTYALLLQVCAHQECNLLDIAQGEVDATKHKMPVTSCSVKAVWDTCAVSSTTAQSLHHDPLAMLEA